MKLALHESLQPLDVHDICFVRPGQRVQELCSFFLVLMYPDIHISCFKAGIGGLLNTISGTSSR